VNILQSTIERLLYILLLLCFATTIIVGVIAYQDGQKIKQQQQIFHDSGTQSLKVIKQNQQAETLAVKTYIACILVINPSGNLQAQEQACFDKAPKITQ
jgi:hypothetical protein